MGGLGWQTGGCPGLSSPRRTAGSGSTPEPSPMPPGLVGPPEPPKRPPSPAGLPARPVGAGKARCPASHQTPSPLPPGRGRSPEPPQLGVDPVHVPPAPSGGARAWTPQTPWQSKPFPAGPARLPSRPLSPPGRHIFRPHCKLSSAGKYEAMEKQAGPQQPGYLPPPPPPQPLRLTAHRSLSSWPPLRPTPAGLPTPRTQSPPSRRELVSGLAEGFGEQAGRQARRCRQSPRAFPLRPSLRCSKPPARVGTAAPGSVTSPAGLGDTRGRGSSGVSPRRPRCTEQSWESPFLHRTGQRTQHCSSPDQGRVPPSPFGPVLKQIRSLLLPVFPPQPPRPPWLEPPGLPSTAPSVGPSTTGGSSPGQRRRGREECVGSGAQTSQENPLQSDLPFPKSREQEAWEHQGAPSSLLVLGMAKVAPLCGRGTDPWPSGVLGWGAAPQTTATPAQSTLCHRCPPPWSPSADSKQPLVQLQPRHGRARTGARKG
ncbi:uncharacterized protein LOC142363765 [Opisthocomus hoazin]|uniref:uncharacterized protein LOC142363765 n=1 Tax=Opisthocomus hoazin TaxID=30419 RepID=UPI003F53A8F9